MACPYTLTALLTGIPERTLYTPPTGKIAPIAAEKSCAAAATKGL